MERTDLDAIEDKLNTVYDRALDSMQLPQALDAIRGLMELSDMRGGHKRGVGFGNED